MIQEIAQDLMIQALKHLASALMVLVISSTMFSIILLAASLDGAEDNGQSHTATTKEGLTK